MGSYGSVLGRRVALAAIVGVIAVVMALTAGAAVSVAADYQDSHDNVCEGLPPCASWTGTITGLNNLAVGGFSTLKPSTSGVANIALGNATLSANTSGSYNVATGFGALNANTTGSNDVATGTNALHANTTGYTNVGTGTNALSNNTTGFNNVGDAGRARWS